MKPALLAAAALAAVPASLPAANIYMLSSGDPATDNAAVAALTGAGHTVTVGVQYPDFNGSVSLAGFQTVYLQANSNWTGTPTGTNMPDPGQQQLIAWVNAGGRL